MRAVTAPQQLLVSDFAGGQHSAAPRGRAVEQWTAGNHLLVVTEAQFAAINAVPEEN